MDNVNSNNFNCKEAVCVQTDQIYDSCRSKECLEDLRVFLPPSAQALAEHATAIKSRSAEVIWAFTDVETLPFNKGFYTVDIRLYFKITLDLYTYVGTPTTVCGLAVYDKRVVLFGSEGNAKIFTSCYKENDFDAQKWMKTNLPCAVVEVVDPIILSSRIADVCEPCCNPCCEEGESSIPDCISKIFDGGLTTNGEQKRVLVSLGIFTIVKLKRKTQLLIPAYDFCIPDKECVSSSEKDPCELFENIDFPVNEFFPPVKSDFSDNCKNNSCDCE